MSYSLSRRTKIPPFVPATFGRLSVSVEMILGTAGIVLCCVGLVFVMPVMKAAWTVAYRQVSPAPPSDEPIPMPFPPPPPPPAFGSYGAT